jgi:2-polyprenyl-3-methyl-5-hydroxy-6-metoxy-1,4-benzoquinol methylase
MKFHPFGYYVYRVKDPTETETASLVRIALKKLYYLLFGTPDLHSHIRYRCIKNQIQNLRTLDVGGAAGYFSFSLTIDGLRDITLSPYTEIEFNEATLIKESDYRFNHIKIIKDDAESLNSFEDESFEQIMVIDVFEHVINLEKAVEQVIRKLRVGGRLVVSVPTYDYPKFFGETFDKNIGHLRHFTLEQLKSLFETRGLRTEMIKPYTYFYTSVLCSLYYKYNLGVLNLILSPLLNILSFFTEFIPKYPSTEIVAVFIKIH